MKKIIASVLFLMIFLSGCSISENNNKGEASENNMYKTISQEEAKRIMDEEEGYLILDVRTEEEYKEGHIPNAINIPNEIISENTTTILNDKEQIILVYCRSGRRSKEASEKLIKLGYNNIYDFGGLNTWKYDIE